MTGIAPAQFKGTNYLSSTALNTASALGMLSLVKPSLPGIVGGSYWPPYVEQEIATIASNGFNNIRLHATSFLGWLLDAPDYMRNLRHLAATCNRHGIVITYQFWTTTAYGWGSHLQNFLTYLLAAKLRLDEAVGIALQAQAWAQRNDPRMAVPNGEPGNYLLFAEPGPDIVKYWPQLHLIPPHGAALKAYMVQYVSDIANFFANDPVGKEAFGSYDLFNEPDTYEPLQVDAVPLAQDTYRIVRSIHKDVPESTVGMARPHMWLRTFLSFFAAGIQTYLSFHVDAWNAGPIATLVGQRPYLTYPRVASEFWHTLPGLNQAGRMQELLGHLRSNSWAGQMWGFLESNAFQPSPPFRPKPVDGILRPLLPPGNDLSRPLQFALAHPIDYAALRIWLEEPTGVKRRPALP